MKQPQDYRIGNKVMVLGNIDTITGISKRLRPDVGLFTFENFHAELKGIHIQNIPLTEDWLLRAGFLIDEYLYLKINDFLSIIWIGYLAIEVNGVIVAINDNEYVHQLMNLYFALTNTELTFKD